MEKKVLQINKYSGGLNSYSDPRDLKENEFQILDNAAVDEEGIIRVSGALEVKNNIDLDYIIDDSIYANISDVQFPKSGKGLFAHKLDYSDVLTSLNYKLEKNGNDENSAWGVSDTDGDGAWNFSQIIGTDGFVPGGYSGNPKFAYNTVTHADKINYNHGSLSFYNIGIEPNTEYNLEVVMTSSEPWKYLGGNLPPRVRIYNTNPAFYMYPNGPTSSSDSTYTAVCNNNISNFFDNSDGVDGYAADDNPDSHTWTGSPHGTGSWTSADNNSILTIANLGDSAPASVEMITQDTTDHYNRGFGGTNDWVEFDEGGTLGGGDFTTASSKLTISPTSATTIEGAQLPTSALGTIVAGRKYAVSAEVVSTSGTIDNFVFELGGSISEVFSISTSTTAITKEIVAQEDGALRIYYKDASTTDWYIDSASVVDTTNAKAFNSLFGTKDVNGDITNGYALKLTGKADGGNYWHASNHAFSGNLTVVANTTYNFDAFCFSDKLVGVRIKNVTAGDAYLMTRIGIESASSWTHITGNTNNPSSNFPQPLTFTTPTGCTQIRIEVGVSAEDDVAYFAGFNIRKRVLEIQHLHTPEEALYPYFNYPNSWGQHSFNQENLDVEPNGSPFIPENVLDSSHFSNWRNYSFSFSSGTLSSIHIQVHNGKWGGADASDLVNDVCIAQIKLTKISNDNSHGIMSGQSYEGYGNLIFFNRYFSIGIGESQSDIQMLQYNKLDKQYYSTTDDYSLPGGSNRTIYNFFKAGERILFCDENFYNTNLYIFEFDELSNRNTIKPFYVGGLNITAFSSVSTFGISENGQVDYIPEYLNMGTPNDKHIPMIMYLGFNLSSWNSIDYLTPNLFDYSSCYNISGNGNSGTGGHAHFNEYAGHTVDAKNWHYHDLATSIHAPGNYFNRAIGAPYCIDTREEHAFTKYFTIPKGWLASSTATGFETGSKIAKIEVDFAHWVVFGNGPDGGVGEDGTQTGPEVNGFNYCPQLKVYLDIVHNDVHAYSGTTHSTALSNEADGYHVIDGGSNILATIGEFTINPTGKKMSTPSGEAYDSGILGYNHEYESPGGGWWPLNGNHGSGGGSPHRKAHFYWSAGDNHESFDGSHDLKATFEFNINDTFDVSSVATSLLINASTGVNLQIRCEPIVTYELDAGVQGPPGQVGRVGYFHQNSLALLSECWRINSINIYPYDTDVTLDFGDEFPDLGGNDVYLNSKFDTPSQGEADGWDSLWTVYLTTVDKNGIESAFGTGMTLGLVNTDVTKCPSMGITYLATNTIANYSKFIKGYMTSARNPNYNLQFIIDVKNETVKSSSSGNQHPVLKNGNVLHYSIPRNEMLIPNELDSYESESGVLVENAKKESKMKAIFKTAIIANNTLYAGNVFQDGVRYPDRMLKSPVGKSPLLPSTNFIDVAINDGDEITCLQFYKDKLLQFKSERLFVINTSEDYEYLEDTIDNVGVANDSQVVITPYGVAWINQRGCYLYDGKKVNNLTDGKLSYKEWKDSESSWEVDEKYGPIITYLKKDDKLIVYGATDTLSNIAEEEGRTNVYSSGFEDIYIRNKNYLRKLGYQYDFQTKSWICLTYFPDIDDSNDTIVQGNDARARVAIPSNMTTNFAYDENGDSIFMIEPYNKFLKWDDSPKQTAGETSQGLLGNVTNSIQDYSVDNKVHRDFRIITKDYDFGAPSVNKKIYKVYVTFKSTEFESSKIGKISQLQDFYSSSNIGVYYAINGTNVWTEFSESRGTNYGIKGLISDDSETTTTLSEDIDYDETVWTLASVANIKSGYVLRVGAEDSDEQVFVKSINGNDVTVARTYNYTSQNSYSNGDTVYISTGDWIVAELKPSLSINNIRSFKLKFETKHSDSLTDEENGVPPGFMINDISVVYRIKNVK